MNLSILRILAIFSAVVVACLKPGQQATADPLAATRYTIYGCNAVSYVPIPDRNGWFIGRRLITPDPAHGCSGAYWTLALVQRDDTNHRLLYKQDVLHLPTRIQGAQLNTAFDPAVVRLGATDWVAFECSGPGISGSSACIGPMTNDQIDPERTYVLVYGNDLRERPYTYTASAPKLMQFSGKIYMYWSSIKIENAPWHWVSIATRGMELTYDPDRQFPILPLNAPGPVRAYQPGYNVEVWNNADMYSIQPWSGKFIATAAATSLTCLKPSDPIPGCFHVVIGVSQEPLSADGFAELSSLQSQIPTNQGSYVRLEIDPAGQADLFGHFGSPPVTGARDVPPGIEKVPISLP